MGRSRFNLAAVGFIALIVLVVGFLMSGSLRRTAHVTLPDPSLQSSGAAGSSQYGEEAVNRVEVTPATVQAAVATLERPDAYARVLVVEWIWGDSSTLSQTTVFVSGELTRADAVRGDGRVRHAVTDGVRTAIWYDNERSYYIGSAGDITDDQEQNIPTYEDILQLEPAQITAADFREFSGESCIYVETAPDELNIAERYWVSVSTGLLVGAERLENGVTFYRMAAQQTTTEQLPAAENFLLPDRTYLSDH